MLFRIDPQTELERRPDVAFISSARWPLRRPAPRAAAWDVIPDLVVEVVSPSDRVQEQLDKIHEFFQAGVRLIWVVYPTHRTVHVYDSFTLIHVLTQDDVLEGCSVPPGFRLPLNVLFTEEDEPQA